MRRVEAVARRGCCPGVDAVCSSLERLHNLEQKVQKQGRDDNIKQLSIQPPYISFFDIRVLWKKIPVGGLYTCIMLSSSLGSVLFAILLSLHLVTF